MGKRAAFGRPGVLDRLRLWWYAKDRSFRANSLLGLLVGAVAVGLVAAAVSREPVPTTGLATAARPYLTTGSLPKPPLTVDIRAAGGVATPLGLPDQSSSTSSTVATVPAPASTTPPPVRPAPTATTATTATTSAPAVATTVPGPAYITIEPPLPEPDPTVPPLPSTTRPPASTPPTAPTTAPSSTRPTTGITLLPPISLPPLLP